MTFYKKNRFAVTVDSLSSQKRFDSPHFHLTFKSHAIFVKKKNRSMGDVLTLLAKKLDSPCLRLTLTHHTVFVKTGLWGRSCLAHPPIGLSLYDDC